MLTHPTLDQMHQLGLAGMARAFAELEANPQSADLSHAEWLGLLLDREATDRYERRLRAKARFRTGRQLCRLTEAGGLSVETVRGGVFYPRWAPAARVLAPADPGLGRVTTIGAAFIALAAVKSARS